MLLIRLNSYPQAGLFDADRFERGLESLGRSVWFLSRRPNWPDAFDVAWYGRAVGVVEADGAVNTHQIVAKFSAGPCAPLPGDPVEPSEVRGG